jgi:hypothetical protein
MITDSPITPSHPLTRPLHISIRRLGMRSVVLGARRDLGVRGYACKQFMWEKSPARRNPSRLVVILWRWWWLLTFAVSTGQSARLSNIRRRCMADSWNSRRKMVRSVLETGERLERNTVYSDEVGGCGEVSDHVRLQLCSSPLHVLPAGLRSYSRMHQSCLLSYSLRSSNVHVHVHVSRRQHHEAPSNT